MFRDILNCHYPNKNEPNLKDKKWKYVFHLITVGRKFTLIAKNDDDRRMWISAFLYITASTTTV